MTETHRHRPDLYASVHKGLRAAMTSALPRVGSLDRSDPDETAAVLDQVRELAMLCRSHLDHEERFVHPAIERRAPGLIRVTHDEHRHHLEAIVEVELLAIEHALVGSIPPEKMAAFMRWMIAAATPDERAEMLDGMRQGAPAEVFEGVFALAREHLGERDVEKLSRALGLAA